MIINANVMVTMISTSWRPKRRDRKALIGLCLRDTVNYGVLHPYKIGEREWLRLWAMDIIQ